MHTSRVKSALRIALAASCAALLFAATPMVAQQATGAPVSGEASAGVRAAPLAGAADHAALILAALNAARTTPTAAAGLAADASGPLTGPRIQHDIRGVEPQIASDRATAGPAAAAPDNRIVISTLALVLIAVIITILVVD